MAGFRPTNMDEFLKYLDLSKHVRLLEHQGYRNLGDVFHLSEDDLDSVHIMDTDERHSILSAVDKIDISSWLDYHGLNLYEHFFRDHEIKTVGELKKTKMTDDLMDELEVMVPGDRKSLSNAASHICVPSDEDDSSLVTQAVSMSETRSGSGYEPVAAGYWGRNDSVPTMNNDLLWVECSMKSNVPGQDAATLTCLVDTASEVVTCEEHIVTQLGLEFIKKIGSKGIHNIKEKPLFKGVLILGNKELEVEVMPDEYNSVGCNVVRQFSHFIDHERHIWFG